MRARCLRSTLLTFDIFVLGVHFLVAFSFGGRVRGWLLATAFVSVVAQVVKDNLRQMDFLARSLGDEFLAILPTASKEISQEIVARVHTGFLGRKLNIIDQEWVGIELNVGWAVFGSDGETPGQLLSLAQLRKEQAKSIEPQNVLWFPQEIVN